MIVLLVICHVNLSVKCQLSIKRKCLIKPFPLVAWFKSVAWHKLNEMLILYFKLLSVFRKLSHKVLHVLKKMLKTLSPKPYFCHFKFQLMATYGIYSTLVSFYSNTMCVSFFAPWPPLLDYFAVWLFCVDWMHICFHAVLPFSPVSGSVIVHFRIY